MVRLALLATLLLTTAAAAPASERWSIPTTRDSAPEHRERSDDGIFTSAERNLIRAWLRQEERRSPPASPPREGHSRLAHDKPLPPGWEQQLARGARLTPQAYGWGDPLPAGLLRRLPPPPPGSEILQIDGWILRLDLASRTILDRFPLYGR